MGIAYGSGLATSAFPRILASEETLQSLAQLALKLKANLGQGGCLLHRLESRAHPEFVVKEGPDHVFGKREKFFSDAMMSSARPVVLQSQKKKKEPPEQPEVILGE